MTTDNRVRKPLPLPSTYDRHRVSAGIAHLGVGNFHRAHQAWYVDRCLAQHGHENWGILGIGLLDVPGERAKADAFRRQGGLYSLTICPPEGQSGVFVIGSILEYLHAPDDPGAVLKRLSDPAIKIVTLTVTEGGYNLDETGRFRIEAPSVVADLTGDRPGTWFGLVTEALRRRREAGTGPFAVMSCDNLSHNGRVAGNALLSFARARNPELADWIEQRVTFPSCMVDRITPGVGPAEIERLNAASGYDDAVPVFAEDFVQWVIEDKFCAGRPRWEDIGVQFTNDVGPYELVKLRMLNASHSIMAYPAVLVGHRSVHLAIADPDIRLFLEQFLQLDAAPLLDAPPGLSTEAYGARLLQRYGNSRIGDQLLRIASDGINKLPVFLRDTTRTIVREEKDHRRIAFALAAFTEYLTGQDDARQIFEVIEPGLDEPTAALIRDPDPARALELDMFIGWGIEGAPTFVEDYAAFRRAIQAHGAGHTLRNLLDR